LGARNTTSATADVSELFNYLIRQRHEVHRQFDARRLRGLEVDDQLVACRLLERQIAWPRTGEYARGQTGSTLDGFLQIGSIRHQAAVAHPGEIVFVKGWNTLRAGVVEDTLAVEVCEHVGNQKDRLWPVASHGFEHAVEVIGFSHAKGLHYHADRACSACGCL